MMTMDDTITSRTYNHNTSASNDVYNYKVDIKPDESRYGWHNPIIGKPQRKIRMDIKRTIRSTLY